MSAFLDPALTIVDVKVAWVGGCLIIIHLGITGSFESSTNSL